MIIERKLMIFYILLEDNTVYYIEELHCWIAYFSFVYDISVKYLLLFRGKLTVTQRVNICANFVVDEVTLQFARKKPVVCIQHQFIPIRTFTRFFFQGLF
jgi:hypothetical protein